MDFGPKRILVGFDAVMGKAAEINAATAKSKSIVDEIGDVGGKYNDLIKNASSVAEKQEIIKGLETDIARLNAMAGDASAEDADQIRIGTGLLEKKLATAKALSEEKLKEKDAAKQLADTEAKAAEDKAANAEKDAKTLDAATARPSLRLQWQRLEPRQACQPRQSNLAVQDLQQAGKATALALRLRRQSIRS